MTQTPDSERKTLILTGASRGIGHATVKRFSTAGWRVISCSRHPFPEDCPWDAGPEDHIQVDLANIADLEVAIGEMKEKLKEQGSKLHALVNNAAISPKKPGGARLNTIETAAEDWKTVFQVNFFAPDHAGSRVEERTRRRQRRGGQCHLDRWLARAPLCGRRPIRHRKPHLPR